jgi:O-antigen ligase
MVNRRFKEFVPPDVGDRLPEGWYGHLHNVYLHYAAERGLPAMLAIVWLLVRAFVDFRRAARRTRNTANRAFLHGAAAATLAVALSGLFEHNLGDSEVLQLFLAVVATGYVLCERITTECVTRVDTGLSKG